MRECVCERMRRETEKVIERERDRERKREIEIPRLRERDLAGEILREKHQSIFF